MKSKLWITGFLMIIAIPLAITASWTIKVDPFFHYHKPDTSEYFYSLYNQRSQNDGIMRNFDYEGLITGTSMAENFKTSEAEQIYGYHFIKVPFSGGTYKEMNDNLKVALAHNHDIKVIIRGLDMGRFIEDYLEKCQNISLIVLLLDIRHNPTADDVHMLNYIKKTNLPLCL